MLSCLLAALPQMRALVYLELQGATTAMPNGESIFTAIAQLPSLGTLVLPHLAEGSLLRPADVHQLLVRRSHLRVEVSLKEKYWQRDPQLAATPGITVLQLLDSFFTVEPLALDEPDRNLFVLTLRAPPGSTGSAGVCLSVAAT